MSVLEIWGLVFLVASSFAATNTDNLILLVVLMGARPKQRVAHVLGFLTSAFAVLCIAIIGGLLGTGIDPAVLGYLGIVPFSMGLYLLFQQHRSRRDGPGAQHVQAVEGRGSGWLSAAVLMFSNSADSLAIFVPLLAESDRESLLWELLVFLVMSLVWAALAWRTADQPQVARRIETLGERLVPWIMMLAGAYILLNTGSDTLEGAWRW